MLEFAKSTLCKWLKQQRYKRPKLSGEVLELDGAWTRIAGGNVELKTARDERGVALSSAGSWKDALTTAREQGSSAPRHTASDGDRAIERAIDMAYMAKALRISCVSSPRCASANATQARRGFRRQKRCLGRMTWNKRDTMPVE